MRRKRGKGKRKPRNPPVVVANEPFLNIGYQDVECTGLDDFDNAEFDSSMDAETLQAGANMSGRQVGLEKRVVNERIENNVNSLCKADIAVSGNLSKRAGRILTNTSMGFGSSSINPIRNAALVQAERTRQEEPILPRQDPRYNEQELNAALLVIKIIMKLDAAEPFNVPVNPIALGIPDYFDVIDTPMDFGTICQNLENTVKYMNSEDVFKDVRLVWENCCKYNKKGDYILELMKRVKSNFMKFWDAAGLYMEQAQAINGYSHLQPPTASNTRNRKHGQGSPVGPDTDSSACQLQDQMGPSQVQSHRPSSIYRQRHQPPTTSNMRHSKDGQGCPVGLDTDNPDQQLPDQMGPSQVQSHQPSLVYSQRHQPPTASNMRHNERGKGCPVGSDTDSPDLQLQDQVGSSQVQSHWPSPICSQRHQPPMSPNMRHNNREQGCPVGSEIDNPERQLQEMGPSQVQSYQPSSIYSQRHQPPTASNMSHSKRGHACPVGSDTNSPDLQLQDQVGPSQVQSHRPSSIYSQRDQPPTASNMRHSKRGQKCPVGSDTDNPDLQLQDETGPSHVQSHWPLSIYSQRHQPELSCNQPQHSLPQPDTSSNRPHSPLQQPDTSSNQPQPSILELDANNASTSKQRNSRGRGPTRCLKLWNREGKCIYVTTNELGQPVGLEAPKLTSFLGTMARDGLMAPLTYADWRAMPDANKEKMWQQVELKFDIDPICKDWVMKSIGKKWKDWKSKLKSAHYNAHATDEDRLSDRDERVLPDHWSALVSYWSSSEGERRSAQNKANRAQQKFNHTTGTKSFARVREELRAKRSDGKEPSRAELFISTRTRKDGRPVNQASSAVISQLREHTTQQQDTLDNSQRNQDDIFSQVMGQDRHGRVRTYGLGPSPSNLGGSMPTSAEALRMVSEANTEVREMKERMVAMEQTCAQMVTQMSTMMVMMSSMQKSPDNHQFNFVADTSGASEGVLQQQVPASTSRHNLVVDTSGAFEGVPQQQVHASTSRRPVSPRETRASKRIKMQNTSTTTKDARKGLALGK